jgi:hypothetical protein
MADEDRIFDNDEVEANRGREQGLGMGQRDLDAQHDPGGDAPAVDLQPGAGGNPEEEWGEPGEGAVYSANHAKRGEKTDAERGPGPKTRKATKDAISRRM